MKSPARQAIVCVLLILCTPLSTQSQTEAAKKGATSSVGGNVTIKSKGAPGIIVILRSADPGGLQTRSYRCTTDQEGNYRITNVPSGTYQVVPAAPAFVISGLWPGGPEGKSLIITEGETVDDVDFAMTRGGVITGRVTDSEGRPLIEEQISLVPTEQNNQRGPVDGFAQRPIQTDDRGIYRIFGVPAGSYKVAVGQSEDGFFGGGRSRNKQTFHPDVTEASKATVIDVSEGSEATNVDITVTAGRRPDMFAVSGRIVDGDTGQPLPNVMLGLEMIAEERNSTITSSGRASNTQGEFKLEHLSPGKYAILIEPQANSELRADAVPFELNDRDVTDLLIKMSRGSSVSGVIVLEGSDGKSALGMLSQAQLHTYVQKEGPGSSFGHSVTINRDGSFRVGGLEAGIANFSLFSDRRPLTGFKIARVERDGVSQLRGLELKDREQVTGVRLVVHYGSGAVRGIVKVENGELPPSPRVSVWLTIPGQDVTNSQGTFLRSRVDSRGHFLVEGLAAGTYEVNVRVFVGGSRSKPSAKQQVDVAEGAVTEVTLTLDLSPNPVPR